MTVELLQRLSLIAFIVSAAFFVLTVILFFTLKIPSVIGYLSGTTERKAIENIKKQTEFYGRSGSSNAKGSFTGKMTESGNLSKPTTDLGMDAGNGSVAAETTLIEQQTACLKNDVLISEKDNIPGTTVIGISSLPNVKNMDLAFKVVYELSFCDSDEIIE